MKFGNMEEIDNTKIINDREKHDHVIQMRVRRSRHQKKEWGYTP
jgi:predicted amidohydrolase